jgi:AraC family transcriptional regulator
MVIYRPGNYSATIESREFYRGFTLSKTHYAAGVTIPRHAHAHAAFVLVQGGALCERGSETLECSAGSVIYRSAEAPHRDHFVKDSQCFNVELSDGMVAEFLRHLPQGRPILVPGMTSLMSEIYDEYQIADDHSVCAIEGFLFALFSRANRSWSSTAPPAWLVQAHAFIADSSSPLSCVSEIAAFVGVTASHLTRAYRRYFGKTASRDLRRRRLDYAKRLIASGVTLSEAAYRAGYTDQSHMTKAFRAAGTTPARYAALMRARNVALPPPRW